MYVSSINNVSFGNNKKLSQATMFKSNEDKKLKYQQYLEKNAYLDEKTKMLNDISVVSFMLSLILDAHHIKLSKKLEKREIFAIASLTVAGIAFVAKLIKWHQLSKQYDKGLSNDTKNYA